MKEFQDRREKLGLGKFGEEWQGRGRGRGGRPFRGWEPKPWPFGKLTAEQIEHMSPDMLARVKMEFAYSSERHNKKHFAGL